MRITIIIIILSVLGCQYPVTNESTDHDTGLVQDIDSIQDNLAVNMASASELIPQKVLDYLKENLSDLEIPDTSEYIKAWWTFYDRDQITYYVTTDFNNDRLADHAFTLKSQNSLRLVILVSNGDNFTHWVADDFNEPYYGIGLRFGLMIRPPSRTDRVVDEKQVSLILKPNGIALMEEETMIRIYYWDNGKFKMFRAE